jgi:hypothetical protein
VYSDIATIVLITHSPSLGLQKKRDGIEKLESHLHHENAIFVHIRNPHIVGMPHMRVLSLGPWSNANFPIVCMTRSIGAKLRT